jgi:hypothetical protein
MRDNLRKFFKTKVVSAQKAAAEKGLAYHQKMTKAIEKKYK